MKDLTGRATTPVEAGANIISCFTDNATVKRDPLLAPVSETGERATRERCQSDWDYVCPTDDTSRGVSSRWCPTPRRLTTMSD